MYRIKVIENQTYLSRYGEVFEFETEDEARQWLEFEFGDDEYAKGCFEIEKEVV